MTPDDPIVCACGQISEDMILAAIQSGAVTVPEVRAATGANTGCGECLEDIEELIEEVAAQCTPRSA